MKKVHRIALVVMALLLVGAMLVACGSSSSKAYSTTVALFINGTYVVNTDNDFGSEGYNLRTLLPKMGHTVVEFEGITAAAINTATADATHLLIPELEGDALLSVLDAAAKAAIDEFVQAGGHIIIFNDSKNLDVVNDIFGYSLTESDTWDMISLNTVAAKGTSFAGGPTGFYYGNHTRGLNLDSLPTGAKLIYNTTDDISSPTVELGAVVLIPEGEGAVTWIGYDFNDPFWYYEASDGVINTQPRWLDVLNRALGGGDARGGTWYYVETFANAGTACKPTIDYFLDDASTNVTTFGGGISDESDYNAFQMFMEPGDTFYLSLSDGVGAICDYSIRISKSGYGEGTSIADPQGLPDAYEDTDDLSAGATELILNRVQDHSFDSDSDTDWYTFTAK